MMNYTINIYRAGDPVYTIQSAGGETLRRCLNTAGVILDAPCGGSGRCGKCLVRLEPDGEPVLACKVPVNGDMDVYLPEGAEIEAAAEVFVVNKPEPDAPLGVAVDIGTTTVAMHLTDIRTGKRIATASGVNAQRGYGADIMSRIKYCDENGHEGLTSLIREQLTLLVGKACIESKANRNNIKSVTIAGNTVMQHLAAGLSPVGMGFVPFEPVSLFGGDEKKWDDPPAMVYYTPAISAFVGGDITAGMLAAGIEDIQEPVIFLDIGTNGEIVMKHNGGYYCCATAAGPAFEGAEITMGMAAISGAIDHIKWEDGLKYSVIRGAEPRGLCGSGLLDALAVLLKTGAVDETGRLLDASDIKHDIACFIDKDSFWLSREEGVYISAGDIRKLQLAKSAIAAGIQTLLCHTGVKESQIKMFFLAGGFGSYMDKHNAAAIGLFPECFLPVTCVTGNAAGEGAALALCSADARLQLEDIRQRCEYIELSSNPVFNEQFIEQMMFNV